jgi:hypothetical protein
VPTSHGAGDLARALASPRLPPRVHAYFHDTDLVEPRRRTLITAALVLLGRRRPATTLDAVVAAAWEVAPHVPWAAVGRGTAGDDDPRA